MHKKATSAKLHSKFTVKKRFVEMEREKSALARGICCAALRQCRGSLARE